MERQWKHKIFRVNENDFEAVAMEIFHFQYNNNPVYSSYINALGIPVPEIRSLTDIPFLPIRFFKSHPVQSTVFEPQAVFESSGTTGTISSRHLVKDLELYKESFNRSFESFYGEVKDWCFIAVLPSYLERKNSSLVYMVNDFIHQSTHPLSGFYLDGHSKLLGALTKLEKAKQKAILLGVTFALLDLAEKYSLRLASTLIMETGGMKGRGEEKTRMEVHDILKRAFHVPAVHSEYGMTELLSQAYSRGGGLFESPPWMKVFIRDEEDPLVVTGRSGDGSTKSAARNLEPGAGSRETGNAGKEPGIIKGAINIIDLANVYSCSFIATDDMGKLYPDGSFEIMGRLDNSDLRGCSLMAL